MKIKELLTDESKWCKGQLAKRDGGYVVVPDHIDATAFCLMGAAFRCYRGAGTYYTVLNVLNDGIASLGGSRMDVTFWNDAPERTFAEVKALVEKLDI